MPKKGFKNVVSDNPALAFLDGASKNSSPDVQPIHDEPNVHHVQPVHGESDVHCVHQIHGEPDVRGIQPVHDKSDVHDVQPVQDKPTNIKYCNINLRLRQDLKEYLTEASWKVRKNVTQYLNDLVEADMMVNNITEGESNV